MLIQSTKEKKIKYL